MACLACGRSCGLAPSSASLADRVAKADGDDTRGPLDIARIVHKHRKGHPNVFIHRIIMQRKWRRRALRSTPKHDGAITVTFDVDPSRGYHCTGCVTEREVLIFVKHHRLIATLYNHLGDPPRKLADLPVWRPNHRTVAFSVRRRQLSGKRLDSYDWGVETRYSRWRSSCPASNTCFDMAPNHAHDLVRHNL
jgi:DNA-binding transcriptional LysR family regulator